MRLNEGLAGLVAEQLQPQVGRRRDARIRGSSTSARRARTPYHSFLGVPLIDRGLLQGVLVVQTIEPRVFGDDDDARLLVTAGAQLAPIVSEARTLGQFVAPAHQRLSALAQNLWWSWDNDTTSLFRELDPVLWRRARPQPGRAARSRSRSTQLEERAVRARAAQPDQLRLPPDAGVPEVARTPGARRHAGVLWARPVAYFSAEFGLHESLPIYSGGLGILAGDHIKSASDLGIPLVGVGLFYDQGYFRQRLDRDGWQHEDYLDVDSRAAADRARRSTDGVPVDRHDRDPHRHDRRARLDSSRSAATRCCCSTPTSTATSPRTAS